MKNKDQLHSTGLNINQNLDGTFYFEWDPKDERWSWMNNLSDDQIKVIMEELSEKIETSRD
jgi:hypothetical protein